MPLDNAQQPPDYSDLYVQAGEKNNVDPYLLRALALKESNETAHATSPANSNGTYDRGLMQLNDGTAPGLGVTDPYNAEQSINGAARYLRQNLDRFNGDHDLAIAAYHRGPGVEHWDPEETRAYVQDVKNRWQPQQQAPEQPPQQQVAQNGLQGFRLRYPQYNGVSDQDLAQKLYDKYYAGKMAFADYAAKLGLPAQATAPPQEGGPNEPQQRTPFKLLTPAKTEDLSQPPPARPSYDSEGNQVSDTTGMTPEEIAAPALQGVTNAALNAAKASPLIGLPKSAAEANEMADQIAAWTAPNRAVYGAVKDAWNNTSTFTPYGQQLADKYGLGGDARALDWLNKAAAAAFAGSIETANQIGIALGQPLLGRDLAAMTESAGMTGAPHVALPHGYGQTLEAARQEAFPPESFINKDAAYNEDHPEPWHNYVDTKHRLTGPQAGETAPEPAATPQPAAEETPEFSITNPAPAATTAPQSTLETMAAQAQAEMDAHTAAQLGTAVTVAPQPPAGSGEAIAADIAKAKDTAAKVRAARQPLQTPPVIAMPGPQPTQPPMAGEERAVGPLQTPEPTPAPAQPRETPPPRPVDAVTALIDAGGVRDYGGDLAAIGADESRHRFAGQFLGRLINPNGMSLNRAREFLRDNGYLTTSQEDDEHAIHDIAANHAAGYPTYRAQDEAEAYQWEQAQAAYREHDRFQQAYSSVQQAAHDAGVTTDPETLAHAATMHVVQGLTPEEAIHEAAYTTDLINAGLAAPKARFVPGQEDMFGAKPPAPRERPQAEPTIRNDQRQAVMPGMEPSAVQAQASRDQAVRGGINPRGTVRPADEGLFAAAPVQQPTLPTAPPRVSRWLQHRGFQDSLAQYPTTPHPGGPHMGAADWVHKMGTATGHEYVTVVDNPTGEVIHAGTAGLVSRIPFDVEGLSPTESYTVHHNHPSSLGMSAQDTAMTAMNGISHVVAHSHDGDTFAASLAPQTAAQIADLNWESKWKTLLQVYKDNENIAFSLIKPLITSGRITADQGNHAFADVISRLLDAYGVTRYLSTRVLPEPVKQAVQQYLEGAGYGRSVVDRSTRAILPEERVAGLPQRTTGDAGPRQAGDQAGDRANAAIPQGGLFEPPKPFDGPLGSDPLDPSIAKPPAPFEGGAGGGQPPAGRPPEPPEPTPEENRRMGPLGRAASYTLGLLRENGQSLADWVSPMQGGSNHAQAITANFANSLRKVNYRFGEIDREIERKFPPDARLKMGKALDAQSVFEQQARSMSPTQAAAARAAFDAGGTGLAGLPTPQRQTIEMLNVLSQRTWQMMQDRGMVAPNAVGIPYYFPRQILAWTERESFERPPSSGGEGSNRGIDKRGGNLSTSGPMRREHLTPEETEAAARAKLGANVNLLQDIRMLPQRLAQSQRAVAGVDLMNAIEKIGKETGVNLVVRGGEFPDLLHPADYFTMSDHPAFRRWTGNGFQSVHVSKEFEGPLKAVLTKPGPGWYRTVMSAKGGVMQAIMFSPFIHLQVELGRALPLMLMHDPVGAVTFKMMRDGSRVRRDLNYMDTAIRDGIVPLGHRGGWRTDPVSIADAQNVEGQNRFLRALRGYRDSVANAAGKTPVAGPWLHDLVQHPHQTLLWDQVFNLQMGLYDALREKWTPQYGPEVAGTMAAHIANRYAGALPSEHLSQGANMAANLALFSRSFTLGNLAVIKDMFKGAPSHVLARIEQIAGPEAAQSAKSALKRKAFAAVTLDIGLAVMSVALGTLAAQWLFKKTQENLPALTAAKEVYDDWLSKAGWAVGQAATNPLNMLGILPQWWNEPGKKDRVHIGEDSQGRGTYLRLPVGKVGEEFMGWPMHPGETLLSKMNPMLRPLLELMIGYDSLGRQMLLPNPQSPGDYAKNAGTVVKHIAIGLGPTATIEGIHDLFVQQAMGEKTRSDPFVAAMKVIGPATGLGLVSQGFPGGPAAGEMHAQGEREKYALQQEMPSIREKIRNGDLDGAIEDMRRLNVPVGLMRYYVRQTERPGPTVGALKRLQGAPAAIQERVLRQQGVAP